MEIINIMVILSTSIICIIWSLRKKKEIDSLRINLNDESLPLTNMKKKDLLDE